MNEIIQKSSKGHKVGSSGAALAILCFFMPWILVSCGGQVTKLNGYDMAAGVSMGYQDVPGKPILYLVLLAAFGVLVLAYLAFQRGSLSKPMDGFGVIALGVVPLLIMLSQFSGIQDQATQQGIYLEFQFGLWGVVIGYLAVVVGGVLNLRE